MGDKSGRLTLDELAAGMEKLGIDGDPESLMKKLDMDQNGYIEYTEFVAGYISKYRKQLSDDLIRQAFEMFDLDGDGFISKNELRIMLSGGGALVDILPDGRTIDEIMEEVGNEDGVISFDDFRSYLNGGESDGESDGQPDAPAVHQSVSRASVEISTEEVCVCGNAYAVDA